MMGFTIFQTYLILASLLIVTNNYTIFIPEKLTQYIFHTRIIGFSYSYYKHPCRLCKHYLDSITWTKLKATFSDVDIENNWKVFFNMISLFRKLATHVGKNLGYE